ncbi:Threonine synthase [Pseudomonas chlororaphis subsp. aurantiaca]|nr:Threonine synthase [Pseudomonas chlororaphis subsp. aurantiaca]
MVSPLRRVPFYKRLKRNQKRLPHHSVPRLGSAYPHSGIDPWAAATGHPWPGAANPASLPGYPRLNACVRPSWLTGRSDQKPKQEQDGGLPAGLGGEYAPCSRCRALARLRSTAKRAQDLETAGGPSVLSQPRQGSAAATGLAPTGRARILIYPPHRNEQPCRNSSRFGEIFLISDHSVQIKSQSNAGRPAGRPRVRGCA